MHKVLDRGAWVALVMLMSLAAGCDVAPLATPHPVDAGAAPAAAGGGGTTSMAVSGVAGGSAGSAADTVAADPQSFTVPDDVGVPTMNCSDGSTYVIDLPCQLGMGPVFETDCAYGPGGQAVLSSSWG
jgi:hypothetical protein